MGTWRPVTYELLCQVPHWGDTSHCRDLQAISSLLWSNICHLPGSLVSPRRTPLGDGWAICVLGLSGDHLASDGPQGSLTRQKNALWDRKEINLKQTRRRLRGKAEGQKQRGQIFLRNTVRRTHLSWASGTSKWWGLGVVPVTAAERGGK